MHYISNEDDIDAINFFNEKVANILPLFWKPRLAKSIGLRILGFRAWRDGFFSLSEAIKNILPGRLQTPSLKDKHYEYIKKIANRIFQENALYTRDKIKLFNKPFSPCKEMTDVDSWLNLFSLLFQIVVKDQYCFKNFAQEDFVVIDVGANVGIFSVMAANFCPQGRIYAFEPNSTAFEALKRNSFYYNNIKVFNYGLGEKEAEAVLAIDSSTTVSFVIDNKLDNASIKTEKIKISSLDDFSKQNNLKQCDFIKIDAEGYEQNVIKGAKNTIQKFLPIIAVSAYHKPADKTNLPKLILDINSDYRFKLYKRFEDILVFFHKGIHKNI